MFKCVKRVQCPRTITDCYIYCTYIFTVCIWTDRLEQTVQTKMRHHIYDVSSGSTLFATHPAIFDATLGSKLYLFKF